MSEARKSVVTSAVLEHNLRAEPCSERNYVNAALLEASMSALTEHEVACDLPAVHRGIANPSGRATLTSRPRKD
ncbi:MAG TPA: hypothetical protein ENH55_01415 [Aurantimonas coralicida]|uniref:Uncharacterized protein n=1 Tax=marine sediment metagenome TaxID=412755 RepID=A0A0F9RG93_9ZZZZ|nr:hypothetical protein [Aurantimonas coralicida]